MTFGFMPLVDCQEIQLASSMAQFVSALCSMLPANTAMSLAYSGATVTPVPPT